MEQALSLRQVADLLKLQHYRIEYVLATHRIAEPALRVANKRVFQSADIAHIATADPRRPAKAVNSIDGYRPCKSDLPLAQTTSDKCLAAPRKRNG